VHARQHALLASPGVSKIASPSTNAEHPLPILPIAGRDVRQTTATWPEPSAFAVLTTLTVCSTQRSMPASASSDRSLCWITLSWTSADHEVHFLSSSPPLSVNTARCCGALSGPAEVFSASEMLCPSKRSPPQPPSLHHCCEIPSRRCSLIVAEPPHSRSVQ